MAVRDFEVFDKKVQVRAWASSEGLDRARAPRESTTLSPPQVRSLRRPHITIVRVDHWLLMSPACRKYVAVPIGLDVETL